MTDHAQLVDLSHTIEHGMMTYKGLPAALDTTHQDGSATGPPSAGFARARLLKRVAERDRGRQPYQRSPELVPTDHT
jgi:hypothetical protein